MSVAVVEAGATGGGRSTSRCDSSSDDDWTSGALANLAAMFPSLEYDVIVSVLAGHGGSVEAAVEYLMSSFTAAGDTASGFVGMGGGGGGDGDPADVLEFRTGADIGGRPEVVPGFMYEEEEEDEEEEEEEEGSEIGSKAGVSSVGGAAVTPPPVMADEQDPLPTYEQAVWDTEFFRSAQDVVAVSASQQSSSSSSSSSFPSPRQLGLVSEEDINSTRETETNCDHQTTAKSKPRRKSKKLKKLASKLSMRRRLDYRAPLEETQQQHPLPQSYQPLIEDDEQPWTPPV